MHVYIRVYTKQRAHTLGGARGDHEADLGQEPQGEAEARDDGAEALDEPGGVGGVHVLEERHEAQDGACVVMDGCIGGFV